MATKVPPTFADITAALREFGHGLLSVGLVCERDGDLDAAATFEALSNWFAHHTAELSRVRQTLVDELGTEVTPRTVTSESVDALDFSVQKEAAMSDGQFGELRDAYLTDALSKCSLGQAAEIEIAVGTLYRQVREQPPAGLTRESAAFLRGATSGLPHLMEEIASGGRKVWMSRPRISPQPADVSEDWSLSAATDRLAPFRAMFDRFLDAEKSRRTAFAPDQQISYPQQAHPGYPGPVYPGPAYQAPTYPGRAHRGPAGQGPRQRRC